MDVVLVQEHKVEPVFGPARLRTALQGWHAEWAHSDSSGSVAIFIRQELLASGRFQIERVFKRRNNGRVIAMEASWGHHHLLIANAHLPNDPPARKTFINEHIAWVRDLGAGRTVLLGGDFNFVPSPAMDRFSATDSSDTGSRSTQKCWEKIMPDLVDIFRHLHPTARCYTRFAQRSAARLDRFHVSPSAVPYIPQAKAADNQRQGGAGLQSCP
jgi:exonuclease III